MHVARLTLIAGAEQHDSITNGDYVTVLLEKAQKYPQQQKELEIEEMARRQAMRWLLSRLPFKKVEVRSIPRYTRAFGDGLGNATPATCKSKSHQGRTNRMAFIQLTAEE